LFLSEKTPYFKGVFYRVKQMQHFWFKKLNYLSFCLSFNE